MVQGVVAKDTSKKEDFPYFLFAKPFSHSFIVISEQTALFNWSLPKTIEYHIS